MPRWKTRDEMDEKERAHADRIAAMTDDEFDEYVEANEPGRNDTGGHHWSQPVTERMARRDARNQVKRMVGWGVLYRYYRDDDGWRMHWVLLDARGRELCKSVQRFMLYDDCVSDLRRITGILSEDHSRHNPVPKWSTKMEEWADEYGVK